jgi:hypothetical protein
MSLAIKNPNAVLGAAFNQAETAALLQIELSVLNRWMEEGLPYFMQNETPHFELDAVKSWWEKKNPVPYPLKISEAIIAVDPGLSGGIAAFPYGPNGTPPRKAFAMPDTETDIRDLLVSMQGLFGTRLFIEDVGGYVGGPGQPGSAMFKFGRNFGFILGVATAYKWRIELVRPQKWQKALGLGNSRGLSKTEWKNKLKAEAQRRFPTTAGVTLKTADALLLLEYAKLYV